MEQKLPIVGIDFVEFSTNFPEIVKQETNNNKQYGYKTQIEKMDGGWSYNFKEGKLKWFMYNSYSDDITQENFDKYLLATQKIIEKYKLKYGEPKKITSENKKFKDPYIERHWGYDVIIAIWETDEMDFKIEFTFMGGKGEYNFLFKMEFQKHGYEYF